MSTTEVNRFISPYDDPAPEGAEGWEALYPYYLHFRQDRREFEDGRFWFADLQHWPTVFKPFDTITVEASIANGAAAIATIASSTPNPL